MWQEWPVVISAVTMIMVAAGYFMNRGTNYLTLREHNEFKNLVMGEFARFHELQQRRVTIEHFDSAMASIERAVDKAERQLENRVADLKFMIAEFEPKTRQ